MSQEDSKHPKDKLKRVESEFEGVKQKQPWMQKKKEGYLSLEQTIILTEGTSLDFFCQLYSQLKIY